MSTPSITPVIRFQQMDIPAPIDRGKVGDVIAALRRKRELNQSELARQTDFSQAYISKLESGGVNFGNLPLATVQKLASVLRFEVSDWSDILAGRVPQPKKEPAKDNHVERLYPEYKERPVFTLQSLADPLAEPEEWSHFRVSEDDHPEFTRAAVVANDDMERKGRSIHVGDLIFLRTDRTSPELNEIYVVVYRGQILLRRFVQTSLGAAFAADNPSLSGQLIPPDAATVLGHVYRAFSDTNTTNNKN